MRLLISIMLTARYGHEKIVRLLISHRVPPDIRSSRLDRSEISGLLAAARKDMF